MAYQLSEINAAVRSDPKAFLETCDGEYRARVSAAADAILERMDTSPIVLLAGPSGSGKTTTAMKLEEELNLDPADFRLWVALHEQTHRVQFAAAMPGAVFHHKFSAP